MTYKDINIKRYDGTQLSLHAISLHVTVQINPIKSYPTKNKLPILVPDILHKPASKIRVLGITLRNPAGSG